MVTKSIEIGNEAQKTLDPSPSPSEITSFSPTSGDPLALQISVVVTHIWNTIQPQKPFGATSICSEIVEVFNKQRTRRVTSIQQRIRRLRTRQRLKYAANPSPSIISQSLQLGIRMAGKNSGICHSCRGNGHLFDQCQMKRRCPDCKTGFQKCFEVEKETPNKGKLFKCCSEKCGFWKWVEEGPSCGTDTALPVAVEAVPEMAQLFQSALQLKDDKEVRISLHMNMTITKTKSIDEGNAKGKGRVE